MPDLDCFLLYEWIKIALMVPDELRRVIMFALDDPILHMFFHEDPADTPFLTGPHGERLRQFIDNFPAIFLADSELIDDEVWAWLHSVSYKDDEINSIPVELRR